MQVVWSSLILCGALVLPIVLANTIITEDDHTIEEALCRPNHTIGSATLVLFSNTTYLVSPGNFCLVQNAQHIHISGSDLHSPAVIKCLPQNNSYSSRGFAFFNVSNLTLENIIFKDCGELFSFNFSSISTDSKMPATFVCTHCFDLSLRNVILDNYWGYALVLNNIFGTNDFDQVTIQSNRRVNVESPLCNDKELGYICRGSGALVTFSDYEQADPLFSSVIVHHSDFIDNHAEDLERSSDKCTDLSFYDDQALLSSLPNVGAITIVFGQTLFNVLVTIESSKFTNNQGICFGGIAAVYLGSPKLSSLNVNDSLLMNNLAAYSDLSSNQNLFGSAITVFMNFRTDHLMFYECAHIQNSAFIYNCTNCNKTLFLSISQLPLSDGFCMVALSNLSSTSESLFLRGESVGPVRQLAFEFHDLQLYGPKPNKLNDSNHGVIELLNIEYAILRGSISNACVFKNLIGPVFSVTRTYLYLQGNISFQNNRDTSWDNGGAIKLYDSFLYLSENTRVVFEKNYALYGGAIYSSSDEQLSPFCSVQYNTSSTYTTENITKMSTRVIFRENVAIRGGNSVYISNLYNCSVKISKGMLIDSKDVNYIYDALFVLEKKVNNSLEEVSSAGNYVCVCLEDGSFDCNGDTYTKNPVNTYPGKTLHFSLVALDKGGKPIYSTIFIRAGRNFPYDNELDWEVDYGQDVALLHRSTCKNVSLNILSKHDTEKNGLINMYAIGSGNTELNIPVFLENCPPGLQKLTGEDTCTCSSLEDLGVSCDVNEGTVTIPPYTWIGITNTSNGTVVGFSDHCPVNFCKRNKYTLLLGNSTVCNANRKGTLCGECSPPYSEVIGSYQCQKCSNWFLLLIIVFGILGVLLVFFLFYLKLTLSAGAMHCVVFYANFLYINRIRFLGTPELIWLQIFFSFINLRLGFPLCLYDGLTTIVSSHLSFVFPVYLWIIAISLVVLSKYSTRAFDLFGKSSVHVLATLIHLSYSTLLTCTVDSLVFNDIVIVGESGTNSNRKVWYLDGNLDYFKGWHATLFLLAATTLVFFLLPYTILLTGIKFFSRYRFVNRFMPLIDAFCASYKDKWRFWFGARLLLLVILYTGSALLRNHNAHIFFMMLVVLVCFTTIQLILMPFKNYLVNVLDAFFLCNAIMLAATSLYVDNIDNLRKGSGTLIGLAFLVSIGVLLYHIWNTKCKHCIRIPRRLSYRGITKTTTTDHETNTEIGRSLIVNEATSEPQPVTYHVLSYHPEQLRESIMETNSPTIH